MMHTLRNRKTGRKSARRRFTVPRRTSQTAVYPVYPDIEGAIRDSNANFHAFVGFKTRVMHTFVSTWGSRPRDFRLSQVAPHVCYFWSSPFRMDEGNTLPSEYGDVHVFGQGRRVAGGNHAVSDQ
jgi:hypothetical protein